MGVEFPAPLRDDCVREDLPFVIDEDDLCSVEEDRLDGCLGKGTEEERVGVVGVFCP